MMDNHSLVRLIRNSGWILGENVKLDERVLRAMEQVDRREFIPSKQLSRQEVKEYYNFYWNSIDKKEFQMLVRDPMREILLGDLAYFDISIPIGYAQSCFQPSMVGFMAQLLELNEGMKVLEIGTGCGYHAAVVSHLLGEKGYLFTVEINPRLVEMARRNLEEHFGSDMERRLRVVEGDGSVGLEQEEHFDRIYFTARVDLESFSLGKLIGQLKIDEGMLLFPDEGGNLIRRRYRNKEIVEEKCYGYGLFEFVPLQVGRFT